MKKSLLALAVLGAFAGAASAQSSVTIYGKMNVEVGKAIGSTDKTINDTAGSRLGFKGLEDQGGGMAANFGIEHRLTLKNGTQTNATNFWQGYSTVGLQGAFGNVRVGRDYTPAFLMVQNQIDPFGGDTQGAVRGALIGNVGKFRTASMVEYHLSMSGFNFGAQIGGANENGGTKKPYSLAANYAAGPLFVGAAIEDPSGADDKLYTIGARYNLGFATLSAGYSGGDNAAGQSVKGVMVGANVPLGAGDFKLGYGKRNVAFGESNKFGIGYHYNLSKRTKVFADYGRDTKQVGPKSGYDFGMQHNF
jgi:predicted porin